MNKSAFLAQNHIVLASATQTAWHRKSWWQALKTFVFSSSEAAKAPEAASPPPGATKSLQKSDPIAHLSTALDSSPSIRARVPDLVCIEQNVKVYERRGISIVPKAILERAIPQLASLPNFKHSTHLQDLMMEMIRLTSPGTIGCGFGELPLKPKSNDKAGTDEDFPVIGCRDDRGAEIEVDDPNWADTCIEPRFDDLPIPMPPPAPVDRGAAMPPGGAWR